MKLLLLPLFAALPLLALSAPAPVAAFVNTAQHVVSLSKSSWTVPVAEWPKILLLRHGEKPPYVDGESVGLNCVGKKRALCLSKILGPDSSHDVGFVISQSYNKKTGHRKRSYSTVKPLADAWGLKVEHSCHKYDPECAARKIREYIENGGRRSCLGMMIGDIAKALGVESIPHYPMGRFDTIWTIENGRIVSEETEDCPGIPDAPPSPPGRGPGGPPGGPPHAGFPGLGPPPGQGEHQGPPRLTEEEEEAAELEVVGEEDEECDLDSYLDSQDWSRWVGQTVEQPYEMAVGEQVVFGK